MRFSHYFLPEIMKIVAKLENVKNIRSRRLQQNAEFRKYQELIG